MLLLRDFLARLRDTGSSGSIHGFEPIALTFLDNSSTISLERLMLTQVHNDVGTSIRDHHAYTNFFVERIFPELRHSRERHEVQLEAAALSSTERVFDISIFHARLESALTTMSASSAPPLDDQAGGNSAPLQTLTVMDQSRTTCNFVECLPLYVGMLLSRALHVRHQESLLQLGSTDFLTAMAHLYHAARSVGHWDAPWADLDFFIKDQGLKSLGLLELPKVNTIFAAAKAYGKVMGVDSGAYNRNLTRKRCCADFRVPLPPETMSAKSQTPKTNLSGGSHFFNALKKGQEHGESLGIDLHKTSHMSLHTLAKDALDDPACPLSAQERSSLRTQQEMTPVQLLTLLESPIKASDARMAFDYFDLLNTCTLKLQAIGEAYREEVGDRRASRGLPKEHKLRDMVDEVLWEAACEAYDGIAAANGGQSLLARIGDVLSKNHTGDKGSACYNAAVAMTRVEPSTTPRPNRMPTIAAMDQHLTSTLPRVVIGGALRGSSANAYVSCTDMGPSRDELRALVPPGGILVQGLMKRFPRFSSKHHRELAALVSACTMVDSSCDDGLVKPKFGSHRAGATAWRQHGYPSRAELQVLREYGAHIHQSLRESWLPKGAPGLRPSGYRDQKSC